MRRPATAWPEEAKLVFSFLFLSRVSNVMHDQSLVSYWSGLQVVTLIATIACGAAVCLLGRELRPKLTLIPICGLWQLIANVALFCVALGPVPNHYYWFAYQNAGIVENVLLTFLSIEIAAALLPKKQFAAAWCAALAVLSILSIGSVLPTRNELAIFNATMAGDCIAALVLTMLLFFPSVQISRPYGFIMTGVLLPAGIHALSTFQWLNGDLSAFAANALQFSSLAGLMLFLAGCWISRVGGNKNGADTSSPVSVRAKEYLPKDLRSAQLAQVSASRVVLFTIPSVIRRL
jgi:hypothetical protein